MPRCPHCDIDLQGTPELTALLKEGVPACPGCGVALHVEDLDPSPFAPAASPVAAARRCEIVSEDAERLVVHIPPGGPGTRALGAFIGLWTICLCAFAIPWIIAVPGINQPFLVKIVLPIGFLAIEAALVWFYVRMKFTRAYLLIEPQRFVLQTQRFGRKSLVEAPLTAASRAQLVEACKINNKPLYTIHVAADGRTFKFGTQLAEAEKVWLKERINQWLDGPSGGDSTGAPRVCSTCGEALPERAPGEAAAVIVCPHCGASNRGKTTATAGISVEPMQPIDLPPDSEIDIEQADADRLVYMLPLLPDGKLRRGITAICRLVGVLLLGIVGMGLLIVVWWGPPQRDAAFYCLTALFGGLALLPGVSLALAPLFIRRGRITVCIDAQQLGVRYRAGPFGVRRSLPLASIHSVVLRMKSDLAPASATTGAPGPPRAAAAADDFAVALVQGWETFLPLTSTHSRRTAEICAGLAKGRLLELGAPLQG